MNGECKLSAVCEKKCFSTGLITSANMELFYFLQFYFQFNCFQQPARLTYFSSLSESPLVPRKDQWLKH